MAKITYTKITDKEFSDFLGQRHTKDGTKCINTYLKFSHRYTDNPQGADLTDKDFSGVNLYDVNLGFTDCSGIDFSQTTQSEAQNIVHMTKTKLEGAIVPVRKIGSYNITYANPKYAYIPDADLIPKETLEDLKKKGAITSLIELHEKITDIPHKYGYHVAKHLLDKGIEHKVPNYINTANKYLEAFYKLPKEDMPLAAKRCMAFENAYLLFRARNDNESIPHAAPSDIFGIITETLFALNGDGNHWRNIVLARQNQEKAKPQGIAS